MTKNKNETNEINPSVNLGGMPALKLNMMDRFYLAVAKKSVGNLVFVYTVGCVGRNYQYDMNASTEIATFDDAKKADIYYQTILEVIDYEKKSQFSQMYEIMVDFNAGLMKNFDAKKMER